jgi:hypothetical protein
MYPATTALWLAPISVHEAVTVSVFRPAIGVSIAEVT